MFLVQGVQVCTGECELLWADCVDTEGQSK